MNCQWNHSIDGWFSSAIKLIKSIIQQVKRRKWKKWKQPIKQQWPAPPPSPAPLLTYSSCPPPSPLALLRNHFERRKRRVLPAIKQSELRFMAFHCAFLAVSCHFMKRWGAAQNTPVEEGGEGGGEGGGKGRECHNTRTRQENQFHCYNKCSLKNPSFTETKEQQISYSNKFLENFGGLLSTQKWRFKRSAFYMGSYGTTLTFY